MEGPPLEQPTIPRYGNKESWLLSQLYGTGMLVHLSTVCKRTELLLLTCDLNC
ncbi:rCG48877 [Rattus norvegicus]|uniref:RCG48877 n=1 Tax=Rattus norvegicus TaxID=10116 RepID=A6IGY4_RAT|nr:rCG48877 [Rattus norvegicus]